MEMQSLSSEQEGYLARVEMFQHYAEEIKILGRIVKVKPGTA